MEIKMKTDFTAMVQDIVNKLGRDALFDESACKKFLMGNPYGVEPRRLLLQAIQCGITRNLAQAGDINTARKQAAQQLVDNYYVEVHTAAGIVSVLADALRSPAPVQAPVQAPRTTPPQPRPVSTPAQYIPPQATRAPVVPLTAPMPVIAPVVAPQGKFPVKERSLAGAILLPIITLGIYGLYWIHAIARDMNRLCAGDGRKTGGLAMVFFVGIITFGIYDLYWYYALADRLQDNAPRYGLAFKEGGGTVLLWATLGTFIIVGPFISLHIIIKNINALAQIYNR
jgi:hypothetical protein